VPSEFIQMIPYLVAAAALAVYSARAMRRRRRRIKESGTGA
jgi:ABC-type uncharacterized transport system permease subunit